MSMAPIAGHFCTVRQRTHYEPCNCACGFCVDARPWEREAGVSTPGASPAMPTWAKDDLARRARDAADGLYGTLNAPNRQLLTSLADALEAADDRAALAEAHDRQSYPTAEAYEQVCRVLDERTAQRDALAARLDQIGRYADSITEHFDEGLGHAEGYELARAISELAMRHNEAAALAGTPEDVT